MLHFPTETQNWDELVSTPRAVAAESIFSYIQVTFGRFGARIQTASSANCTCSALVICFGVLATVSILTSLQARIRTVILRGLQLIFFET